MGPTAERQRAWTQRQVGNQSSLTYCQDACKCTLEVKYQKKTNTCCKSYRNSKETSQLTSIWCFAGRQTRAEMSCQHLSLFSLSVMLTLCDPTDRSMLDCPSPSPRDVPVLHHLPELAQTHVHGVGDVIQPSHPVVPFSSRFQSFPASESFLMNWLFTSGGQSIEASASASVLQVNTQD